MSGARGDDATPADLAVRPAHRLRGYVADALVLAWVVAWVAIGRAVHAQVMHLAAPGRAVESAGRSLEDQLRAAAGTLGRAPLLGEDLQAPFSGAADAAATLAGAGVAVQDGVSRAALLTALAVAAWPIVVVVAARGVQRWRAARRAAVARRLLGTPDGVDLLALRALARAPVDRLAAVGPDPVGAWRRGDPDATRALAGIALAELGLRAGPPRTARRPPGRGGAGVTPAA